MSWKYVFGEVVFMVVFVEFCCLRILLVFGFDNVFLLFVCLFICALFDCYWFDLLLAFLLWFDVCWIVVLLLFVVWLLVLGISLRFVGSCGFICFVDVLAVVYYVCLVWLGAWCNIDLLILDFAVVLDWYCLIVLLWFFL